jgi:hypothetical protein
MQVRLRNLNKYPRLNELKFFAKVFFKFYLCRFGLPAEKGFFM